jgi:anaerobic selenocysteine-containing dehydrogenase
LCTDRKFPTSDGKAHFQPVAPPRDRRERRDRNGTFVIATRRGKQFNSMVQRERDPLTGAERDHILISAVDAARLSLATDDELILKSAAGEFRGRAFIADVAPGTLQGHWPEINVLISAGRVEPHGGVPDYNAEVEISRPH